MHFQMKRSKIPNLLNFWGLYFCHFLAWRLVCFFSYPYAIELYFFVSLSVRLSVCLSVCSSVITDGIFNKKLDIQKHPPWGIRYEPPINITAWLSTLFNYFVYTHGTILSIFYLLSFIWSFHPRPKSKI